MLAIVTTIDTNLTSKFLSRKLVSVAKEVSCVEYGESMSLQGKNVTFCNC